MTDHADLRPMQERDELSWRRVSAPLFGTTAIGLVLVGWCHCVVAERRDDLGGPSPVPLPTAEYRRAEQASFEEATAGEGRTVRERERLERYGWIDREHGRVHIPVDRAIDLVVKEER